MSVDVEFYLIVGQRFNARGWTDGKPSIRTTKGKPDCAAHEVAIAPNLSLPEGLFRKPALQARIVVPEDQAPNVITPDIEQSIAETLREQFGITLQIAAPVEPDHG